MLFIPDLENLTIVFETKDNISLELFSLKATGIEMEDTDNCKHFAFIEKQLLGTTDEN